MMLHRLDFLLRPRGLPGLFFAAICLLSPAPAATLMLDAGALSVTPSDATNSPLHAVDSAFTGTSWNNLSGGTGAQTGLVYADGTAATGISVYVGRSSASAWQVLTFAGAATSVNSNTNPGGLGGVFASSTSVGRDTFYGSGTGDRIVGAAIGGLAAGSYEVYIVGLNPSLSLASGASMGFWAAELSSTANFDATSLINAGAQATSTNSVSASWVEGGNYVKLAVTLSSANSYLTLIAHGLTETEQRGFLNAIQIVAVPEPAPTAAALAVAALAGVASLRRRAKRGSLAPAQK